MSIANVLIEKATDSAPGKAVVLYDGLCPFCQKAVRLLKRLDWRKRFHYQDCRDTAHLPPCAVPLEPAKLLDQMHLVTPDRKRIFVGFGAFRWMAWRLPLMLPIAPFLYLPGIPWLGTKIYLWIAKNRFNLVPCEDGVCRIPLPSQRTEVRGPRSEDRDQKPGNTESTL